MVPYETILVGREIYEERLARAAAERRAYHLRKDAPSLFDRTALYLGERLIDLGERLKHQHNWETTARSGRA